MDRESGKEGGRSLYTCVRVQVRVCVCVCMCINCYCLLVDHVYGIMLYLEFCLMKYM